MRRYPYERKVEAEMDDALSDEKKYWQCTKAEDTDNNLEIWIEKTGGRSTSFNQMQHGTQMLVIYRSVDDSPYDPA